MSNKPSKREAVRRFQKRLFASRFFTTSALLHFILVLAFGSKVLIEAYAPPDDFVAEPGGFTETAVPNAPPPSPDRSEPAPQMKAGSPAAMDPANLTVISTSALIPTSFEVPQINMPTISSNVTRELAMQVTAPRPSTSRLTAEQAAAIREFTDWGSAGSGSGNGDGNRNGHGKPVRIRHFTFTAYLAKYSGGDWSSTNWISNGKIYGGSLPNLLYAMNHYSKQKIDAKPDAVPLDLSSQEIFSKRPPFIFFTGHRDFKLTDREVANLRKYISLGGCIWGDSSLPGRRSRFDIAFRREMRRVIPDADKGWEVLPPDHAMFTKNLYFPEIKAPTSGMNYYQEPVYALKYLGEVAILYTANDYGDMWQMGLTADGKFDMSRNKQGQYVAMNRDLLYWKDSYYHNLGLGAVTNSYKFGMNVVVHLLTRWEDRLANAPIGL